MVLVVLSFYLEGVLALHFTLYFLLLAVYSSWLTKVNLCLHISAVLLSLFWLDLVFLIPSFDYLKKLWMIPWTCSDYKVCNTRHTFILCCTFFLTLFWQTMNNKFLNLVKTLNRSLLKYFTCKEESKILIWNNPLTWGREKVAVYLIHF